MSMTTCGYFKEALGKGMASAFLYLKDRGDKNPEVLFYDLP